MVKGIFLVKPEKGGNIALSRRGDFKVSADGILTDGTGTAMLNVRFRSYDNSTS